MSLVPLCQPEEPKPAPTGDATTGHTQSASHMVPTATPEGPSAGPHRRLRAHPAAYRRRRPLLQTVSLSRESNSVGVSPFGAPRRGSDSRCRSRTALHRGVASCVATATSSQATPAGSASSDGLWTSLLLSAQGTPCPQSRSLPRKRFACAMGEKRRSRAVYTGRVVKRLHGRARGRQAPARRAVVGVGIGPLSFLRSIGAEEVSGRAEGASGRWLEQGPADWIARDLTERGCVTCGHGRG
jgi:hypothetical protein